MSTFAELKTEVCEQIGSINTTDDDTKLARYLNRGVRHVLRHTHCYQVETSVTPGAADNYTLAASLLDIVDASFTASAQNYELERVTPREIRRMRRASASTASGPTRYYALAGANLLMFYPQPGAADTLSLLNVPAPTAMSSGSHDPSNATYGGIPSEFHEALEFYACFRGASYDDDESSSQGQRYYELFRERISQIRKGGLLKGGRSLPRARVGRQAFSPRDPSTDFYVR